MSAAGFTPAEIRHVYGFDQIVFNNGTILADGSGQTIAIVDAYDDPNIASDLTAFDSAFGLPDPPSFTRAASMNSGKHAAGTDPKGVGTNNWELETALDVEWRRHGTRCQHPAGRGLQHLSFGDMVSTAVNWRGTVGCRCRVDELWRRRLLK